MSDDEFAEWHDAVYGLYKYGDWFKDKHCYLFSFLWLCELDESVRREV